MMGQPGSGVAHAESVKSASVAGPSFSGIPEKQCFRQSNAVAVQAPGLRERTTYVRACRLAKANCAKAFLYRFKPSAEAAMSVATLRFYVSQ